MPLEVGLLASFAAGLISFLSPCILPLIPINLAIIGAAGSGWKIAKVDWRPSNFPWEKLHE